MGDLRKLERETSASQGLRKGGSGASEANRTVLLTELLDAPAEAPAEAPADAPFARAANSSVLSSINIGADTLAALNVRYEVLAEAGHGSMGDVYKARDRETGGIVALKLLKLEIASDQKMLDRFKNELLFARKITHKNVCRVYEFNRANGIAYTSMEFVEGESLRSLLTRDGKISSKHAVELALEICSGLKEAHAQGIVHRDLKPENVMIDSRGHVKIMDFGIARSMDAATRLTGSLAGTPAYMAPEQVAGKPVDYRTDIYSLGLMLYEMFTGAPAFQAENSVAVALKQMREEPVPPHVVEPKIPFSIERAILKCLEKEPARRFLSIGELETALAAPHAERTLFASAKPTPVAGVVAAHASAAPTDSPAAPSTQSSTSAVHNRAVFAAPSQKRGASPLLWALVGAAVVCAAFAANRAAGNWRSADRLVFAEKVATPAPPAFAFEIPLAESATDDSAAAAAAAEDSGVTRPAAPAKSANVAKPPVALPAKAAIVAHKSPAPPEVFPRMETGPSRKTREQQEAAPVSASKSASAGLEYVWVGSFVRKSKAEENETKLKQLKLGAWIVPHKGGLGGDAYVLFAGPIQVRDEAADLKKLRSHGFKLAHPTPATAFAQGSAK